MKIGIDAKWYFNGHPSGKVVVENIVNEIVKLDETIHFFIFLDSKDKNLSFPIIQNNIHLVYVPNFFNALTNFFIMPFYTVKYKLDVCMYQNYAPFFGSRKIVNYVHDSLFMDFPQFFTLWERIYFYPMKYLSKYSNHVITISHSEKKRMINHGFCKKENISVVHHGLGLVGNEQNFNQTDLSKKYDLPKKFVLYLGRLNVRKNIQNLLRAMPHINEDTTLVIVGSEDHKTMNWNHLIETLGLKNRVVKTGFVATEDIKFFYQRASVFCFPSFAEGFGLPPLEAMHYGVPVVVSNTTSLPEVCADSAFYADPEKPLEIANQINKILDDTNVSKALIKKGHQRVSMFSWEKASTEILDILKSI